MKLASVEIIKNIRDHSNADTLQIGEVLGWQVVVKKGSYAEGEKIVFITIDTIVPKCSWSEFLADKEKPEKPIRIKNIKLRGEFSSGLVVSLDNFPAEIANYEVGSDMTEFLGVKKYIKELPANLSGENEGDFPTHIISKTDEDNGLNDPELVQKVLEAEPYITITLKIDGSSCSIIIENGEITKVCSRNLSKKETENSLFWKCARQLKIPEGWSGVIQGEIYGNGIQRNRLKIQDVRLSVFQIKTGGKYMDYESMADFCKNKLQCEVVPLIGKFETAATSKIWENPLLKLQELADKQWYSSGERAEGIVIRPSSYPKSFSSRRPLGFKLINRNYKD